MQDSLVFKNDLTIDDLLQNTAILRDALSKWDRITVDVTDVQKIDVAAIQMLIAAKKECENSGKKINFMTSGAVDRMLYCMGLEL
jgi:ABC-type transporter Mla MlaB component